MGDTKISNKYRTIHSISDQCLVRILNHIDEDEVKTFLDFGCHMGHLSINIALDHDIDIYAVDNFIGTPNDELMSQTVGKLTGGKGNFWDLLHHNIEEAEGISPHGYTGRIKPMYDDEFFKTAKPHMFDMAYIDAAHDEDTVWQFLEILKTVKVGGIIGGHDSDWEFVIAGMATIEPYCTLLTNNWTWFMRKDKDAE